MLRKLFGGGGGSGSSIDVEEAHRRVEAREILLVDVRENNEWKAGHAPRAKHVPLGRVQSQLPQLAKKGVPIAFVCRSGSRSGKACGMARSAGIEAINVSGGMTAWSRAGLPMR